MRFTKVCVCIVLVGAVGIGTAGCGIFDLINAGLAAAKVFGGTASDVTASEWELMSRAAADAAGRADLALTSEEAAAIAKFLADNNIDDLGAIGDDPSSLTGLEDLADAFQERAGPDYDLSDPADAEAFFQDYGQEVGEALADVLADLGVEVPTSA